mmetsp:Transcript_14531/g.32343  ORF Transcript_14531/g.32343 Transcript_14531/m.32343 type:complete len:233 (-) Transcript_14531:129-827(-)
MKPCIVCTTPLTISRTDGCGHVVVATIDVKMTVNARVETAPHARPSPEPAASYPSSKLAGATVIGAAPHQAYELIEADPAVTVDIHLLHQRRNPEVNRCALSSREDLAKLRLGDAAITIPVEGVEGGAKRVVQELGPPVKACRHELCPMHTTAAISTQSLHNLPEVRRCFDAGLFQGLTDLRRAQDAVAVGIKGTEGLCQAPEALRRQVPPSDEVQGGLPQGVLWRVSLEVL